MALKIGLFVDVANTYFCLRRRYNLKLNYKKLHSYVSTLGDVTYACAYGCQKDNEAESFISKLNRLGFSTKWKKAKAFRDKKGNIQLKADWDVAIAIDIVSLFENFDLVVIVTSDGDLVPAVKFLRERGKDVLIMGSRVSDAFHGVATNVVEIPQIFVGDSVVVLLKQQTDEDICIIFAAAMILDTDPDAIIREIGHDGLKKCWPNAPKPYCYRGFHVQEIIDVFINRGKALVTIEPRPILGSRIGRACIEIYPGKKADTRIRKILDGRRAIIETPTHAVAWDGKEVYNPGNGKIHELDALIEIKRCHVLFDSIPVCEFLII